MTALLAAELIVAGVGLGVFLTLFVWRSNWRDEYGGHVFAFTAVIAALVGLRLVNTLGGSLPDWLWALGWLALDVVCWWRVALLVRSQRTS